jgi:hypothetical protein
MRVATEPWNRLAVSRIYLASIPFVIVTAELFR